MALTIALPQRRVIVGSSSSAMPSNQRAARRPAAFGDDPTRCVHPAARFVMDPAQRRREFDAAAYHDHHKDGGGDEHTALA